MRWINHKYINIWVKIKTIRILWMSERNAHAKFKTTTKTRIRRIIIINSAANFYVSKFYENTYIYISKQLWSFARFKIDNMSNLVKHPPLKPIRVPTFKLGQKPDFLNGPINSDQNKNDVNAAKMICSLFDLAGYECDIISNKAKHLDRRALIESNRALLVRAGLTSCCHNCYILSEASAEYLGKYLTYEDLKVMRFNYDFGLGVFTGLELVTLPQGEPIRTDIIERF